MKKKQRLNSTLCANYGRPTAALDSILDFRPGLGLFTESFGPPKRRRDGKISTGISTRRWREVFAVSAQFQNSPSEWSRN